MFCWCGGSLALNEDIVRSRCGGQEATLPPIEKNCFFSSFGEYCTILIGFDPSQFIY